MPDGKLHRHEDGREHRHFSAGLRIGAQVRPDADGTQPHQHYKIVLGSGVTTNKSGPVVWTEDEEER